MKFVFLKKRLVCFFVGFLVTILVVVFLTMQSRKVNTTSLGLSIVIDAGHGGIDGGAVGVNGTEESRVNLDFAIELKNICEQAGFNVIMTRPTMDGLYSPLAQNKKRSEMEKREEIINNSKANLVVSIHQNSFPLPSLCGAQVFYKNGSEGGKHLAENIQNSLKKGEIQTRGSATIGDYYVLNCTDLPAVLVECGFLSNPQEEMLLCQSEYRKKFCEQLFCGILEFYSI